MGRGQLRKARNKLRRMLTIRIHGQDMSESRSQRQPGTVQHRRPLALIGRQFHHAEPRVTSNQHANCRGTSIVAAIDNDPYVRPLRQRP